MKSTIFRMSWNTVVLSTAMGLLCFSACDNEAVKDVPFSYRDCLDHVPDSVQGLKILAGPRTEKNIIRDMNPSMCQAYALLEEMRASGRKVGPGSVVFKVVVDYNGEVMQGTIDQTDMDAEEFLDKVVGIIGSSDFTYWRGKNDEETVFLYPVRFDQ